MKIHYSLDTARVLRRAADEPASRRQAIASALRDLAVVDEPAYAANPPLILAPGVRAVLEEISCMD
jgi:hypothetical protein